MTIHHRPPLRAIRNVLEYCWDDEWKHFRCQSAEQQHKHIFWDLLELRDWFEDVAGVDDWRSLGDVANAVVKKLRPGGDQ